MPSRLENILSVPSNSNILIRRYEALKWYERKKGGKLGFAFDFEFDVFADWLDATGELSPCRYIFSEHQTSEEEWMAYVTKELDLFMGRGFSLVSFQKSAGPLVDSGPLGRRWPGETYRYDSHITHTIVAVLVRNKQPQVFFPTNATYQPTAFV